MNEEAPKTSKLPLWLIIFTTLAVMVSGFLLFPNNDGQRDRLLSILGTNNRGTLLNPVVMMADMTLTDQQGEAWLWQEQAPKWRLLLPFVGDCEDACRDFLYTSRQVHIRLDKKTQRVKRVFLNLGAPLDDEMNAFLKKEHPYLTVVRGDLAEFSALIASTNAQWRSDNSRLFLVDQQGVGMMFYTPEHDGSDLLGDLKHLIKYSPEL
jgi:cytochrome oxidase Cu insertion factor (SCO1/SenC/PrrC family)